MGPGNNYHECGSKIHYIEGIKIKYIVWDHGQGYKSHSRMWQDSEWEYTVKQDTKSSVNERLLSEW